MRKSPTSSNNDTGHAAPEAEKTLGRGYLICVAQNSAVGDRHVGVKDLHSGLERDSN